MAAVTMFLTVKEKSRGNYIVKHGRKMFAKVVLNMYGQFAVEKTGLQWTYDTLDEAFNQVKELAESTLSMWGYEYAIELKRI